MKIFAIIFLLIFYNISNAQEIHIKNQPLKKEIIALELSDSTIIVMKKKSFRKQCFRNLKTRRFKTMIDSLIDKPILLTKENIFVSVNNQTFHWSILRRNVAFKLLHKGNATVVNFRKGIEYKDFVYNKEIDKLTSTLDTKINIYNGSEGYFSISEIGW